METKGLSRKYIAEDGDVSLSTSTFSAERAAGYHISQLIAKINREEGVKMEQIAESLQISPMRLRSIMTGSTNVTDQELSAIADRLEVKVADLLQPLSDDIVKSNNVHCMGTAADTDGLNSVLDKIDLYVRLLNLSTND